MNILFIASRPPWPPTDGGRVLMANTIDGLLARGHTITVVTPTQDPPAAGRLPGQPRSEQLRVVPVPHRRPSRLSAVVLSLLQQQPLSVVTQASASTRAEAGRRLGAERYDVVHVEQVQALPQADAALERRVPIVLRAENVESDLWHALAATRPFLRPLVAFEARRLARFEARAVAGVAATVALTESDATRLRRLSPRAAVDVVRAPMAAGLPAGDRSLEGDPPLVVVASRWMPNQEGVTWFAQEIWPAILSALPGARLHLFGADSAASHAVVLHKAPAESRDAFAAGAILVVPLRIASGVRVRILEAWSRGVPVVATRAAIEGLDVKDGLGVRVADGAEAFVRALTELCASPEARARLVRDGRALLAERHDPDTCAAQLETIYRRVIDRPERTSGRE